MFKVDSKSCSFRPLSSPLLGGVMVYHTTTVRTFLLPNAHPARWLLSPRSPKLKTLNTIVGGSTILRNEYSKQNDQYYNGPPWVTTKILSEDDHFLFTGVPFPAPCPDQITKKYHIKPKEGGSKHDDQPTRET